MLFNSRTFLVFYLIVTSLYFTLPHRWRWFLLLSTSAVFYMAFVPIYILILGWTIIIDYFAGIYIENLTGYKRRLVLVVSLISNIGVLAFFKYFNFLNESVAVLLKIAGWHNHIPFLAILLPIGLSFHTFQAMSYTIEVYRGRQKAERNFGIYALYVMFYPQLVAGPIERPQNLLHQFREKHNFNYRQMSNGLKLMLWGLFKKAAIGDRLAIVVNQVYTNPTNFSSASLVIATIFFAFQIYCDFSGYTDIARGAAQSMGFRLMKNFKRPYFAYSIAEFWKRWHISLSTWFRDYLYIPLGGSRVSISRWFFNLFIVFLVSGLWHGANWTFIIWGALHGFYFIFSISTKKARDFTVRILRLNNFPVIHRAIQTITTFSFVTFAWIFFRANTITDAIYIIRRVPDGVRAILNPHTLVKAFGEFRLQGTEMALVLLFLVFLGSVEYLQSFGSIRKRINRYPTWTRWSLVYALLVGVYFLGIYDNLKFIYFQF